MPETSPQRRRFHAPWIIFWVGFGLRVAVILIGHTYRIRGMDDHFGFGWEMGRIARSLVLGQGYANPFNGLSGPTAWTPPLYPLLMALAFKLFGIYTNGAAIFLLVCNSVFSAGIAPAVYEIAARCFDARGLALRKGIFFGRAVEAPVALWSAWLWAVYPAALQYAIHWIWEMSLSTFLLAWIVVVALRLRERRTSFLWVVFGGLWGLLALSNASVLLCLPSTVAWIAWPELRRFDLAALRRDIFGAFVAGAIFCLVMTPWWWRNERALQTFVATRSNLGVELYNSSLPANDGLPWGTAMPLWEGDPEFRLYERMGEVPFAKMRQQAAVANLRAEPGLFVKWTLDRVLFFWDGTPHPQDGHPAQEYLRVLSYSFLSACGLLGLALMLRRRVQGAGLFALVFLLVPVPYYVVTVQARFRHPIEPLIAVLAVYLFRSAAARRGQSAV